MEDYEDYRHKMCSILCVTGGQCFSYVQESWQNHFLEFGAALDAIPYSEHPVAEKNYLVIVEYEICNTQYFSRY